MKFKTQIFTHFDRCDLAGIVFFGNYAAFAHQVLEEFIPAMGIEWRTWFHDPSLGIPVRKLEVEYLKPLFAGRHYTATAVVERLGQTSVTFCVEFSDGAEVCSRIRSVHVFLSMKEKKVINIPESFRDHLSRTSTFD